MAISFDGDSKLIHITSPTTFTTAQDIYDEAMEWADEQENMVYGMPLEAAGYAAIGGGVYTDKIFILLHGWKIKPWSGTYQLRIQGSLITDDESQRSVQPDTGNVEIVFEVATYGTVTAIGSGVTPQDKLDIADKVWEHTSGIEITDNVEILKKIATGRWKIVGNQLIFYDEDQVTPIYVFNLKDKTGQPTETEPYERVPT